MILSPNVRRYWLYPLGALLLGAATGAGGRWLTAPGPRVGSENGAESSTIPRRSLGTTRVHAGDSKPTGHSADEAWADRTRGGFGRHATWILQADEDDVARTWELWTDEHGTIADPVPPLASMILIRWAELDPDAMIEAVDRTPVGYATWARVDFEAAVSSLRDWLAAPSPAPDGQPPRHKPWNQSMTTRFLMTVAQFDPGGARDLVRRIPELRVSEAVVAQLDKLTAPKTFRPDPSHAHVNRFSDDMLQWARARPDEALRWLAEHVPPGTGRPTMSYQIQGFMQAIPLQAPQEIVRLAETLPAGDHRNAFLKSQAALMARGDPDAAIDFANAQQGSQLRISLLNEIGIAVAWEQPERLADVLAEIFSDGDRSPGIDTPVMYPDGTTSGPRTAVHYQFLQKIAAVAPGDAMAMFYDLPGTTNETGLGRRLAVEWLHRDEIGYEQWLVGLKHGPKRDAFVGLLVEDLSEFAEDGRGYYPDHLKSLEWITRIDDKASRTDYIRRVMDKWWQMNRVEAETFMQSPAAPEAARACLPRLQEEAGR